MGSPSTTTSTEIKLTPEQERLLKPVIPIAEEYIANPPQLPEYSEIAPFNPTQEQAQQQLIQAAGQQQQLVNAAASANQFLMNPAILSPESNPYLQATIDAAIQPIQQQLLTETLPSVGTSAEQAGQYGSSRQGIAEGLATQGAQQAAVNVAAPIAESGYQSGLTAMTQSLGLAPSTTQALTMPALSVGAVGDVQQAMDQALLSEQAYRDMYKQTAPFMAAQEVAALAAGIPGGGAETTQPGPTTDPITAALGGLSLAASLFPTTTAATGSALTGMMGLIPFL